MALIKTYFELTQKYISEYGENTIFLIQVGAFFECYGLKDHDTGAVYGSHIMDFSRICDLNIVDKRVCVASGEHVVMGGFKEHLLDKYIKKLQDAGYTVAVYVQDEQCANTTRSLLGVFSPGTYFSTDTDETNITNNTCCIWIEVRKKSIHQMKVNSGSGLLVYIGVSVIDIYTGKTSIMEYSTNYIKNPTTFDELEHFVSIYNPSETIVISNLPMNDVNEINGYINIKSKSVHLVNLLENELTSKNTLRALNCEKQTYQTQLLSRFYKFNDLTAFMQPFLDKVFATQSFCYLLDFIYQHNPNLIYKIAEPTIESESGKLILANHSLKQLNIIDSDQYKGKYSSVVRMLNECVTSMGKRKFNYDFLNPVTDVTYLEKEYSITDVLLKTMDQYKTVKTILSPIKDLEKIWRQIMLQKVSPKCIYQLYSGIESAKQLYLFLFNNCSLIKDYLVTRLSLPGNDFSLILTFIDEILEVLEKLFILDECKEIDNIQKIEKSFIQSGVDLELDNKISILSESQDQLEACRSYFNSIVANYETSGKKTSTKKKNVANNINVDLEEEPDEKEYIKIHETEKNNFSLIATDRRCKILEELLKTDKTIVLKYKSTFYKNEMQFNLDVGKDVIDFPKQSASSKSISSPQISKLCKNIGSIKVNIIDSVIKVYNKCIKDLEVFQERMETISHFIMFTDVIYSKAFIAEKYDYCKPEIDTSANKAFVDATDLRHCLIEKLQQSELYVANDINLGHESASGTGSPLGVDGILLYGTNAVGKTSFIRSLGISVIMAQAGLYVPASKYRFKPYTCIFTRILGNDNLFKGLSTFAVEMSELRSILRLADENSMVLGDELCSGTESISAASIFVAGIQTLGKKQCSFIFATHLHEIIGYDEITNLKTVVLKHMSVIYDKETDALIYDRKLKDGPGNNMYGLEVCKSLSLPQDFLDAAHEIRMKYHPVSGSILDAKASRYNASKIKGLCEKCNVNATQEVHHLQYQQHANDKGIIKKGGQSFHKNNAANLLNLCEKCHDELHSQNKVCKKVKTTKGQILQTL
jgi:DNA mismatch repair protein MutS